MTIIELIAILINAEPFLQLRDVLLWPSVTPLISLAFLGGVLAAVHAALKHGFGHSPAASLWACGYVVALGLLASGLHVLAEMHVSNPWVLRGIGTPFCALGLLTALRQTGRLRDLRASQARVWRQAGAWARLDLALMAVILVALSLCACAPPTDADSLDYHLGVPLQILRQGGFYADPVWLHSRLIGLGEYLNLMGLALGTDNLGAVLAWSALAWLAVLVPAVTESVDVKRLLLKLVLALPVLLFLVPNQKPQLIGTLALVAAYLCALAHPRSRPALLLSVGAVLFACGLKFSFYLASGVMLLALWQRTWQTPGMSRWLVPLGAMAAYLALVLPLHLYNALHYRNPVSPFAAALFGDTGGMVATAFARRLAGHGDGLRFPLNLLVPDHLGNASTVLGAGVFAAALIRRTGAASRQTLGLAAATAAMDVLFCQHTSRFFVDAYVLGVLALGFAGEHRRAGRAFDSIVSVQLAGVAALATLGAGALFPGTWSWAARDQVMERAAHEYAAMQAIDWALPTHCLLFCDLRSNALAPRPFVPQDYAAYLRHGNTAALHARLAQAPDSPWFVAGHTPPTAPDHPLRAFVRAPVIAGTYYPRGTRNPLNHVEHPLFVYELDSEALRAALMPSH